MIKRVAAAIGLIAVLLGAALVLQRTWTAKEATPAIAEASKGSSPSASEMPAPAKHAAKLKSADGEVQVRGTDGSWRKLATGDGLHGDDLIRTSNGATAQLQLGDNVIVDVAEDTTLSVQQVSESLSQITLDDGRVMSKVREKGDFRFRVKIRNAQASAETKGGKFGVLKRGDGPAAVAAEKGTVELRGDGGRVTLSEGQMSTVSAGHAPAPPTQIPSSLYLKFAPPAVANKRSVELQGETSPGAVVRVSGARSGVGPSGRFKRRVELSQGVNEIVVVVEDPLGRTASVTKQVTLRKGPKVQGEVQW